MDAYPREAWLRLGRNLRQRRPKIDSRYRIRKVFAEENNLTDKTVQEIENAYRTTFSDVMLATIERAYRLKAGSIERALSGGDIEPEDPVARIGSAVVDVPESATPGVHIEQVDDGHVQARLTIATNATMAQVEEALEPLSPNERAMIANMEALEFPPAEIGGAILMLRRFREHRAGQQDAGHLRRNA